MLAKINKKRRCLLQYSLLAPATLTLQSLHATPNTVPNLSLALAITPEIRASLLELFGSSRLIESHAINLKVPRIGENAAVLPVSVTVARQDIAAIAIYVTSNTPPLSVLYYDIHQAQNLFSTRIRVQGSKAEVIAVIATRKGDLFAALKTTHIWSCNNGGG